jgi:tRNA(Ile)-lysidine synthase
MASAPACGMTTEYWLPGTGYLYHFTVRLSEQLLTAIRKQALIKPGDRVATAVSGGADSVALLLLLLELRGELGIVLSVAHVNHKLRGEESDADECFVAELSRTHHLELHCCSAPLNQGQQSGIEAAARKLRYEFFRQIAHHHPGMKIATAHTLDDQAETVLLRILRGTGIRGLAGIHPRIILRENGRTLGEVVRPLLGFCRAEIQDFLRASGQTWREDSTNRDPSFLRNRVRHAVLPLLKENFGPAVIENLSDLAEIARAEDAHWRTSHPEVAAAVGELSVDSLLAFPLAAQRRLLRAWIEIQAPQSDISFRMIEDVLNLASSAPEKAIEIPSGRRIRRTRGSLRVEASDPRNNDDVKERYEYSLPIPGEVTIAELNLRLQAVLTEVKDVPESERLYLLDPDRLPKVVTVRNWQAGDRFWPAYTKEPRKVKELLNDRHVTGPEKKLWPVIVAGEDLLWMHCFPVPESCRPQSNGKRAIRIHEIGEPK